MAKFLTDILAKAGIIVDGAVTFNNVPNAAVNTNKFLVLDSGVVKYRTATQLLSDLSVVGGSGTLNYVSKFTGSSTLGNSQIFDDGTNVGVGTTSPAVKLEVSGVIRGTRLNSTGGVVDFDAQTGNNFIQVASNIMSFANGSAVNMTIAANGNVGIGTNSPTQKLHVLGDTRIENGSIFLTQGRYITWNSGDNYIRGLGGYHLQFTTYDGVSGQHEVLRLTGGTLASGGGRVGIGATSPIGKLNVLGSSGSNSIGNVLNNGVINSSLVGISNLSLVISHDTTVNRPLLQSANASDAFSLLINPYGGNVLIGTTTDGSFKLDVNGAINTNAYLSLSGSSSITTSDYLYKTGSSLYWKRNRVRTYIERTISGISSAPADYNKYYEIGSFSFFSLEGLFNIDIAFSGGGFGQGSRHIIPLSYNMDYLSQYSTGLTTYAGNNVWLTVDAISQTPRHILSLPSHWELQMNVVDNVIKFRIIIKGSNGESGTATAFIKISHNNDFDNCTYTELTGTGTDAVTYPRLPAIMSGINGTTLFQNTVRVGTLAGTGTRMVVAGSDGTLSTQTLTAASVGAVGGSGTTNYVAKFSASGTVGNSQIFDNGTNVGIGTSAPANRLDVRGIVGIGTPGGTSTGNILTINATSGGADNHTTTISGPNAGTNDDVIWELSRGGGAYGQFNVRFNSTSRFYVSGGTLGNGGHSYINPVLNFGVGTITPSDKLHVVGGVRVGDTTTTTYSLRFTRTSNSIVADSHYYTAALNTPVQSWIEGGFFTGERAGTITAANSSNPYYEEYLAGGGAASQKTFGFINKTTGSFVNTDILPVLVLFRSGQLRLSQYTSTTSFTGTIVAGLGVDSSGNLITTAPGGVSGTGTTNYVPKWSDADTLTNSQIFDNGTNVGIGTITPSTKLDVNGDIKISTTTGFNSLITHPLGGGGIGLVSTTDPTAVDQRLFSLAFGSVNYPSQARIEVLSSEAWTSTARGNYMTFSTTNIGSTTRSEKVRITHDGNVGIGTTSPTAAVTVSGINIAAAIDYTNTVSGTGRSFRWVSVNAGGFGIQDMTAGGTDRLRMDANGNLGIGTTSPNSSALLDVSSTTKGFLPPRMTSAQRAAISSPAAGLVVYQTDGQEGLWLYTVANGWKSLAIVN